MAFFILSGMALNFSLIVPVYNRPDELRELLHSLQSQEDAPPFEVVIVEDGSDKDAAQVVESFRSSLSISYWKKPNTGPGDSRNFGMRKAGGNYFVLVDSDCLLPSHYFAQLKEDLSRDFVDCFGGPDRDHPSFTPLQKAISFSMTSPLTTGGIRGGKHPGKSFQPRSFNMGLSQAAFMESGGFGDIHPGEDPDLSLRLKSLGYRTAYLPDVFVYHKRRSDFPSFYRQVFRFGMARPVLNRWHPGSARIHYWFPSLFLFGGVFSILLPLWKASPFTWMPLAVFLVYLGVLAISSGFRFGSLQVGFLAVIASLVQFLGYGVGFLKSVALLTFSKKKPQQLFPSLFFKS